MSEDDFRTKVLHRHFLMPRQIKTKEFRDSVQGGLAAQNYENALRGEGSVAAALEQMLSESHLHQPTAEARRNAVGRNIELKPRLMKATAQSGWKNNRYKRKQQQKRERETARIEKDIETRETRMKELEALLADPALYHDVARSKTHVSEYEKLRSESESLWQRLAELG